MLTKFEVTNFKNFGKKLTFDLTKSNFYEFNKKCVINGVVNKALLYGHNGVGKSNLGFAVFDLVSHLTDKQSSPENYSYYLNASTARDVAHFQYEFMFKEGKIIYKYGKSDYESLIYEKITVNNKDYASIDRRESSLLSLNASGAENLKRDIGDSKISIASYVRKNSVLDNDVWNRCFNQFFDFVNGMLFFRSLHSNKYIGFEQGARSLESDIIERGNIEHFEKFLNKAGIECKLSTIEQAGKPKLAMDFNGSLVPFFDIASSGTISLSLFYFWHQRLRGDTKVKFLFIDEFDAFYHHSLSVLIVDMIKNISPQTIMTTHNTSIMTNELMRPDCYFLMKENKICSLANSTAKELREAHNIEKMYKAGAFNV